MDELHQLLSIVRQHGASPSALGAFYDRHASTSKMLEQDLSFTATSQTRLFEFRQVEFVTLAHRRIPLPLWPVHSLPEKRQVIPVSNSVPPIGKVSE